MAADTPAIASPDARDLLRLRLSPAISRNRFRSLVQAFGSYENMRQAGPAAVAQVLRCPGEDATALVRGATPEEVARELEGLAAIVGRVVVISDPDYPAALRPSPSAPPLLFVRGTLSRNDEAAVAVIGSRKATAYGMAAAQTISRNLARAGITIISGFARGIDTAAHRAALDGGGRTLGVLGCGLDVCYPPENRGLIDKLTSNGALISEYPLGTAPLPGNFPERNQIIAALALGTAVMEAAERSGTLITCRHALEENRLLFALPGDITRHSSRGTNRLIREGAILIQDAADILRDLAPRLRSILTGWNLEDHALDEDAQDNRLAGKAARNSRAASSSSAPSSSSSAKSYSSSLAHDGQDDGSVSSKSPNDPAPTPRRAGRARLAAQYELPGLQDFATEEELASLGESESLSEPNQQSQEQLVSKATPAARAASNLEATPLPPEAEVILSIILREPIQYDNLIAEATAANLPPQKVASTLLRLELKGLIQQLPGRIYAAM